MSFNDSAYTPLSFDSIMASLMQGYNTQFGTSYTVETFEGTNAYKFLYAVAQRIMDAENDTAEIYSKLQDYLRTVNETIAIPKTPIEGLIQTFAENDLLVSVDDMTSGNAGTLSVCVNVDPEETDPDYDTVTLPKIIELLALNTSAGLAFDGTEEGNYTFSNGQTLGFAYHLPDITNITLRATISISVNNRYSVDHEADVKAKIIANMAALYGLGMDFEPKKYLDISRDAPYASSVLLEWSDDAGSNWHSTVFTAAFDDLFVLENGATDIVSVTIT